MVNCRAICLFVAGTLLFAECLPGVADAASTEARLKSAAGLSKGFIEVHSWAEDREGRTLSMAQIGSGDSSAGAILLVGGLDGRHQIGVELAIRHVEKIAADADQVKSLLGNRTIYIVPEIVPAGFESLRSEPSRLRSTASGESDSDRDGLRGEDLADDLDGDRVIRQVRVLDPDGEFVLAESDSELLHSAKAQKDETGAWRLLIEGRDDDGDENWNEEEDGGVWLAQNFPNGYEWFARGRGPHQVSEVETRATADFLAAHSEIAAVWVYGFEDNLLTPPPAGKSSNPNLEGGRFGRSPIEHPNEEDLPWLEGLSERYRKSLGLSEKVKSLGHSTATAVPENEVPVPSSEDAAKGGLAQYVYYDRGRLALATPAWTPALQASLNAAAEAEAAEANESDGDGAADGGDAEKEDVEDGTGVGNAENLDTVPDASKAKDSEEETEPESELPSEVLAEETFIAWLTEQDADAWKPWSPLQHPDFPGQQAYVGGYAPGARINPPESVVDELASGHHDFLLELISLLPEVRLRAASLRGVGKSIYELSFSVENIGWLPDVFAHGEYSSVVRPTRFNLVLPKGGEVLGEAPRGPLDRMDGRGGSAEETLLLHLPSPGSVTVEIISEFAGTDRRTIRPGSDWRVER